MRQPPEIDLAGISTENYFKNPVVMWAHDVTGRSPSGGLPIGRTLALDWKSGRGLVADFEFLSDDPFAQRVRNAWDKGFLRAASISWIPLESRPSEDGGRRDTRADLLEWSIVSVPADPEALRDSHGLMLDAFLSDEQLGTTELHRPSQVEDEMTEALSLLADFASGMRWTARPRADPALLPDEDVFRRELDRAKRDLRRLEDSLRDDLQDFDLATNWNKELDSAND